MNDSRLSLLLLAAVLAAVPRPCRAQPDPASVKARSDKALADLESESSHEEKPAPRPPAPTPAPEPAPAPAPAAPAAVEDPLQKGLADAKDVLEKVGSGQEAVDKLDALLDRGADFVRDSKTLSAEDKLLRLKELEQAKEALAAHTKLYGRFADAAGKTKDGIDIVLDVKELAETMADYQAEQGSGAANLQALVFLGKKFGGDIPVLGDAITAYAEITEGILKATHKLSGSIRDNQQQGALGQGAQSSGEKAEAFRTLFGDDAGGHAWVPTETPWIYTVPEGRLPDAVWDGEAKSFQKVPQGSAPDVHRKYRLTGKDLAPSFLVALCQPETRQKAQEREKAAEKYLGFLGVCTRSLGDEYLAYLDANKRSGWVMREWLRDPNVFIAKYAYDGAFKAEAQKAFKSLYEDLAKKLPADSPLLKGMREWAAGQELALAPAAGEKPEPCWKEAYDYHKSAVDWYPKIHDKDAFSHYSCQPMHSAQESPSKACCERYYATRNEKGMWDKAWDILQECGWKDEIEQRRLALEKKKAACAANPR